MQDRHHGIIRHFNSKWSGHRSWAAWWLFYHKIDQLPGHDDRLHDLFAFEQLGDAGVFAGGSDDADLVDVGWDRDLAAELAEDLDRDFDHRVFGERFVEG